MQWFDAATCESINDAEEENRAIDPHIAFAERHLITDSLVTSKLASLQTRISDRIAEIFETGDLLECFDARHPRFLQGIIRLFTKQKEGPKPELVAQRFIHRVDHIGGECGAHFHQYRSENRQPKIQQYKEISNRKIMPGYPTHDAVASADPLSAAHAVKMIFTAKLIELTASVTCCTKRHH